MTVDRTFFDKWVENNCDPMDMPIDRYDRTPLERIDVHIESQHGMECFYFMRRFLKPRTVVEIYPIEKYGYYKMKKDFHICDLIKLFEKDVEHPAAI